MKRIKILGITGGVGAGKSMVLDYLSARYGAGVLQLDRAAHLLMEPGQECCRQIAARFGAEVLDGRGGIDRARLYEKAFADDRSLRGLNAIVHPRVKEYVRGWIEEERKKGCAPFLVLEAALLLEDHYEQICDEIWYIYVSEEKRRERLTSSRGYSQERIRKILEKQRPDEEFRAGCQFVVDNSSDLLENTYGQIDKGLKEHEFV